MKYLAYILLIVLFCSAFSAYFLLRRPAVSQDEVALIINQRRISSAEYNDPSVGRLNHVADDNAYRETFIARELLIQEGKRRGIDQEEDFRRSIQRYYEQSLVKVLMDRQYATLQPEATSEDVARYLALRGTLVRFTVLRYSREEDVERGVLLSSESRQAVFEELSSTLRVSLATLSPGSSTVPAWDGLGYEALRLDAVEPGNAGDFPPPDLELVRQEIINTRRELRMNEWLTQLRRNAVITIPLRKQ